MERTQVKQRPDERQKQVLQFLVDGLTAEEMAGELRVSVGTVEKDLKRLYESLGGVPGEHQSRDPLYVRAIVRGIFDGSIEVKKQPQEIHLTVREFQVAVGFFFGETMEQTANELTLSSGSVSTHRSNIYRKLGANGFLEAVGILATYLRDGKKVVTPIGLAGLNGGESFVKAK